MEEHGILITNKLPSIISSYVSNNVLHILLYLNISKSDIEFVKVSHVWEISGFTLIPIASNPDKRKIDDLAQWLIKNITDKNPCSSYISLKGETITAITNDDLPKNVKTGKYIFSHDDTYYIKLESNPRLTIDETRMLKYINLVINGFEDDMYVFDEDRICHIQYEPYYEYMYLQLATQSIIQIDGNLYTTDAKVSDIDNYDKFKRLLNNVGKLDDDVVRTIKSLVSKTKNQIEKFGIKNVNNTSFYYLDKKVFCCYGDMNLMFNDIDDFDYVMPMKKLMNYYNGSEPNYYQYLYEKYGKEKLENPLYLYDFDYDLDEILLQYVKCIPHMSLLLTWAVCNITDITKTKFYDELSKNGKIHAIKEIVVTLKQIQGIIYQVYYNKSVFKQFDAIRNKAERCSNKNNNRLFIIFYVANDKKSITGTDAPFKVHLRKILKENGLRKDLKDNLYLHITDKHSEVVELAQLFCNKNSMRLLQYQRLDRLTKMDFWKSLTYLMTLKSWMYSLISPIDQIRFLLFSSIVLYTLGLRNMNDLDMIVHYLPTSEKTNTKNFFNLIETYFEKEKTKFPFVVDGVSMKNHNGWYVGGEKEYLIQWFEKDWPELFGAKSMDDIIINPKFHYYFFGMKIVSIEGDTIRRNHRSRPAAYADLIAMKLLVNSKLDIQKIPEGYWKNHVYYKFTDSEINELIKKTQYYLGSRYHINLEKGYIKSAIV
jgi:hypothetical protein